MKDKDKIILVYYIDIRNVDDKKRSRIYKLYS